jgi:hypothetical protein
MSHDMYPYDEKDEFGLVEPEEIKKFLNEWGQKQREITASLGYPESHSESDELLMEDYFWLEGRKEWYPKNSIVYSDREEIIVQHIRDNAWKY